MLSYKIITLLYLVLNITVTQGLRFFKPRKKKKECLIREGWNFHYVTCASKYQKCCDTGCCDRSTSDISLSYIRVFIVCALIVFIFMLVYIEMWCKKRCKLYKNNQQQSTYNRVQNNDNDLENAQEMQIIRISNNNERWREHDTLSHISERDESDDEVTSTIRNTTPPPPYNGHNDLVLSSTPMQQNF